MPRPASLILAALAIVMAATAIAAERIEAELVVFHYPNPPQRGLSASDNASQAVRWLDASADSGAVQSLPPVRRRLAAAAQQLEADSAYQLLHHAMWVQPLGSASDPRVGVRSPNRAGFRAEFQAEFQRVQERTVVALAGRLYRPTERSDVPDRLVARLQERRPMEAGALHYFDHPAFGALLEWRPVATEADGSGGAAVE
jgi:hypothetical protein